MINKAATARAMAEMRRAGARDAEKRVMELRIELRRAHDPKRAQALRRLADLDGKLADFLENQAQELDMVARAI